MKCFEVYLNDLKGILSPLFYISQPKDHRNFIELNKIAEINPHRRIDNLAANELVPYVGLPETSDMEIKEVLKRPYKEVKGRGIIKQGDILFARIEPSIFNQKYIMTNDLNGNDYAFTSTEFYVIKPKQNINSKFLFYMLFSNDVYNQILGKTTGSTGRRRLDKGVFEQLLIPNQNRQIQDRIVEIMDSANAKRRSHELKANELIGSIDSFIISELGIKLPELKEEMFYTLNSNKVQSKRFDPYYYQPMFEEIEKAMEKGKFPLVKLESKIKILDELEDIGKMEYINYVDLKSIDKNLGTIKNYTKLKIVEAPSRARQKIENEDLLVSALGGSLKSIAVFDESFDNAICSTGFHVIKKTQAYNNYYLWALFRSLPLQIMMQRESSGAIMPAINREAFVNLRIPIPPATIQNEIAKEIERRMKEAKQLEEKAKKELDEAKQQVERLILNG